MLASAAMVTVVSDREGDLFPGRATVPGEGFHVLTRAMVDRPLAGPDGGTLFAAAAGFPVAGTRVIEIPARWPDRAGCVATLEVRFGAVEIRRPHHEKDWTLAKTVRLRLVDVREITPPEGVEPLHWWLLTAHEVTTAADAWRVIAWYQARWTIEQLFRVMKSQGLGLEDSQVASADRLVKLAAAAAKAACIDIQLVQEGEGTHGLPVSTVFSGPETGTIEALSPTLEGRVERQENPHPFQGLAHVAWVIARLGGWNCYGKPPGPITMRRGMERFHAIHPGRMLGMNTE